MLNSQGLEREHLIALVSKCMRRVLVDHARARLAAKRSSSRLRLTLSEAVQLTQHSFEDVLDLHLSLERFASIDPRAARVVEMIVFGGFTQVEVARYLGVAERTVRSDYSIARAWIQRELAAGDADAS